MSRIGKLPIKIPSGVTVEVNSGSVIVKGTKGELSTPVLSGVKVSVEADQVIVSRNDDEAVNRAKHGLMRTLIQNMVVGVSKGFSKKLEINGVGFRVSQQGSGLKFNLGFSHDVMFSLPEGVSAAIEQNTVTVSGIDKQQVGQVAAEIRGLRKPEPYKGKGIKYADERILRKSGKSGKE